MSRGKLIVIEGGDGAGKATQAKLLLDALLASGRRAQIFDFPRYEESVFGKLTGELLKGVHGDFRHMSPYVASLSYTLDRAAARNALVQALEEGDVICNRYTTSSLGFQSAKLPVEERAAFIEFLERGEYEEMGIPRPDLVIYLHVPVEIATELVAKKEVRSYMGGGQGEKDQHERDLEYQKDVEQTYLELTRVRPDWVAVECVEDGKLRMPEEIHKSVKRIIFVV